MFRPIAKRVLIEKYRSSNKLISNYKLLTYHISRPISYMRGGNRPCEQLLGCKSKMLFHPQAFSSVISSSRQASPFLPRKFFSKKMPSSEEEFRHLDYSQFNDIRVKGNSVIIDVREKNELDETGTIPGSHHIPLGDVEKALGIPADVFEKIYSFKKPNSEDELVFSCRSGKRSLVALEKALSQGFTNAKHYTGGWLDWEKKTSSEQK